MTKYLFAVMTGVLCLSLLGCGERIIGLAPVSGTVTLNGKPLAEAQVFFQMPPVGDAKIIHSAAFTDAEGKYTLKSVEEVPRSGAMPGTARVRISFDYKIPENASQSEIAKLNLPKMPERATDGSLSFVVTPEGSSEANFDL
ncbi:MAG: carboxypeptidase-like regulatory domain-containing protein [Planctomycetia bacterium]|nr:carboxypeptidase-like regulatory domain-containing protein [Planctomycetia bacterium]